MMTGLELSLETPWSSQLPLPVLLLLQLLPVFGGVLLYRIGNTRVRPAFGLGLALGLAALHTGVVFWLSMRFDSLSTAFQFAEYLRILGPLAYHVGLDGLSLAFLQLISLLGLALIIYTWAHQPLQAKNRINSLVLLSLAASTGLVLSLDLLWFWLMAGLQLWAMGHLLQQWSPGQNAQFAIARFKHFMGISQLFVLGGILMLGWHYADITNSSWSFNLLSLRQVNIHQGYSGIIFFLLILGFGLRTPVFPLHGWLPNLLEHSGPSLAAVLLLGVKLGIYAILRILLPLLPETALQWQGTLLGIAFTGCIYATLLAILQSNLRRQLAYISIAQSGLLLMGVFSLSASGIQGTALLALTFGLGSGSLLLLLAILGQRTSNPELPRLHGLMKPMPLLGLVFFLSALSLMAIPGAPGFEAQLLLLEASVRRFGAMVPVISALSSLAASSLLLWVFHQAFITNTKPQPLEIAPGNLKEVALVLLLLLSLATLGFHPEPWLRLLDQPSTQIGKPYTKPDTSPTSIGLE